MNSKEFKQVSKAVREILKNYNKEFSLRMEKCLEFCDLIDKEAKENTEFRTVVSNWLFKGSTVEIRDSIILELAKKYNNLANTGVYITFDSAHCKYQHRIKKIEEVKRGQYFTRKPDSKKSYEAVGYCRDAKRYQGNDLSDISGYIHLAKGTIVYLA